MKGERIRGELSAEPMLVTVAAGESGRSRGLPTLPTDAEGSSLAWRLRGSLPAALVRRRALPGGRGRFVRPPRTGEGVLRAALRAGPTRGELGRSADDEALSRAAPKLGVGVPGVRGALPGPRWTEVAGVENFCRPEEATLDAGSEMTELRSSPASSANSDGVDGTASRREEATSLSLSTPPSSLSPPSKAPDSSAESSDESALRILTIPPGPTPLIGLGGPPSPPLPVMTLNNPIRSSLVTSTSGLASANFSREASSSSSRMRVRREAWKRVKRRGRSREAQVRGVEASWEEDDDGEGLVSWSESKTSVTWACRSARDLRCGSEGRQLHWEVLEEDAYVCEWLGHGRSLTCRSASSLLIVVVKLLLGARTFPELLLLLLLVGEVDERVVEDVVCELFGP